MATTALGGRPAQTVGELPATGSQLPAFELVGPNLAPIASGDLSGRLLLNIFPSVDTVVCAAGVRRFNEVAANLDDTTIVNVSMDLPFAQARFCGAEGIDGVVVGSAFRSTFGDDFGVRLTDSAFEGLLARAVVVADDDGTVLYTELVPDIDYEPDYDAALAALQ